MRYDTQVFFQNITPGEYDQSSGDYGASDVKETMRYASVTDTGADTLIKVYGELKQNSFIVRIQGNYDGLFNRIRIGSKLYHVDFSRRLRTKHVFVVSEVQ